MYKRTMVNRNPVQSQMGYAPGRTAFGVGFLLWVFLIFFVGSADRIYLFLGWSYQEQIWIYRGLVWVLPIVAFFITRRVCRELQAIEHVEKRRELAEAEAEAAGA